MSPQQIAMLADLARNHLDVVDNLDTIIWAIRAAMEKECSTSKQRVSVAAIDVLHLVIKDKLYPQAAALSAALNSEEDPTDAGQ